jgi:menaquinone-dependent protoporphyrinogen oxidase
MDPTALLIAYASKHGSTCEVALALAEPLRAHGFAVDVQPAADITDVRPYAAVVLGGALYTGRWHKDARHFLARHAGALAERPLAVYALGPGSLAPDDVARSRTQLDRALHAVPALTPVAAAVFGGVVKPDELHFPFNRMPAADARDWDAIRAWGEQLAARWARAEVPTP